MKKTIFELLDNYPDVLNITDICSIFRISRKTAYQFLKSGAIPYRKIGRLYRIRKEAVINFLRDIE